MSLPVASRTNDIAWLDGKVIAVGQITDDNGKVFSTATMVVSDLGNPEPRSRNLAWLVVADAAGRKTNVPLNAVGIAVKLSIRSYRFALNHGTGFIELQYVDAKGKEKMEEHMVIRAVENP